MTVPYLRAEAGEVLHFLAAQQAPHLATLPAEVMRSVYSQLAEAFDSPFDAAVKKVDLQSAGPPLRAYFPGEAEAGPVILFMHGGGWVLGDLEDYDALCGLIAVLSGLRVVSVDYRRAPEHPFPCAHEDSFTAAQFISAGPSELGAPVTGLAVAGDSAGGNLALHIAAKLGAAAVLGQFLLYPLLDCTDPAGGSYEDFAEGYLLDRRLLERFIVDYSAGASRDNPTLSPLLHPVSSSLPPAVILTAGVDPLRDQGRALATLMIGHGIEVHYLEAKGLIHGMATMRKALPAADGSIRRAVVMFAELIGAAQKAREETEA